MQAPTGPGGLERGTFARNRAVEQGIELRVEVNDMRNWLSACTYAESAAWAKVLIDKQTDLIVGAHILGHAGEELIHKTVQRTAER